MAAPPEKVIGVLGGMGPEATVSFYAKLVAHTPAARDQDHLRVVIDSNPKVPDRTAALLGEGPSPVPMLVAGVEALARAGADFVVIPCVSAHAFLDDLRAQTRLPVLSMLDAVADHLRAHHPHLKTLGLLATSGTVAAGRFQDVLAQSGIRTLVPDAADQARVMAAIHAIKGSAAGPQRARIGEDLRTMGERLAAAGAQGVVLGCTEVPLVLSAGSLSVPVFDAVLILARAAITAAGREPAPEAA
jgi:aspartate racemase